ncbi:aminoglycoside phosphotransferase family protein [uncultured Amnibacterium sp.]|uniref:aminoglycoside phosphotransferase family protein n=1 Tax=uncultured Amnibacterium sp. TaxID=1631851 RepID=UPI0035CC2C9E
MNPKERLRAWGAEPTGEVWRTPSSDLAAGIRGGEPVMLKVARIEEERRGGRLMAWWSGCGGLPVLEADDDAILMRRATRSLLTVPAAEAEGVLLETVLALHAMPAPPASVGLVALTEWFHDLVDEPQAYPLLARTADVARGLVAEAGPSVALHGDLHHGNVLELDGRWIVIDPKGLVGHPAFDVANVFCNPSVQVATARLDRRLGRFADRLAIEPDVLAAWVVAWCGLSLVWAHRAGTWHASAASTVATALLPRLR